MLAVRRLPRHRPARRPARTPPESSQSGCCTLLLLYLPSLVDSVLTGLLVAPPPPRQASLSALFLHTSAARGGDAGVPDQGNRVLMLALAAPLVGTLHRLLTTHEHAVGPQARAGQVIFSRPSAARYVNECLRFCCSRSVKGQEAGRRRFLGVMGVGDPGAVAGAGKKNKYI